MFNLLASVRINLLFSRLCILMETRTIVASSSNANAPTITKGDKAK